MALATKHEGEMERLKSKVAHAAAALKTSAAEVKALKASMAEATAAQVRIFRL